MFKERAKAIVNLVIAFLVLMNAVLTASGRNPLPFDQDSIGVTVSYLAAAIDTIWIWWHNNNLTVGAATGTAIGRRMNKEKDVPDGTGDPEGE